MARRSKQETREEQSNPVVSFILFGLLAVLISVTSVMMTSYPQHLLISKNTTVDDVQFLGANTVMVEGHQSQYSDGDRIRVQGRGYIQITGKQIQLKDETYPEGVRTIVANVKQNILFQKSIGTFSTSQVASIVVGNTGFNLIPLGDNVVSVHAIDLTKSGKVIANYNVQFMQQTVFLNENGVMLKLAKTGKQIDVSLIGTEKYSRIVMKVL